MYFHLRYHMFTMAKKRGKKLQGDVFYFAFDLYLKLALLQRLEGP